MEDRSDEVEKVKGGGKYIGGTGVGMKQVLFASVCAIVVSIFAIYMLFLSNLVSKKDFTTNIQGMSDVVTKTKTDLTQIVTNLQNTVNALPASIAGQVNTAVTQAISSINSQLSGMASAIKSASDKVDSQNTKIDTLTKQLTVAEDRIKVLEDKAKTTTSTTGSSSSLGQVSNTLNGVTVSIASYTWLPPIGVYGYSSQSAGAMLLTAGDNGTGSTTFQLIVQNTTGKTIQNLTMTLGFSLMDYTSTGTVPTITVTPTLVSQGGLPAWVYQSSGAGYLMFYNGAFAGFFGFNPPVGDTTIYCTLNILGTAGQTGLINGHQYYLFPMVKIQSFS